MIRYFPNFYPDELVYSLLSRYCAKVGHLTYRYAAEELFLNRSVRPDMDFVNALKENLPQIRFIAEDLGFLTQAVLDLRDNSGYPGMKVLEFAFDSREPSEYLPHTYIPNTVCYVGTHDNMTMRQWFDTAPAEAVAYAREYMTLTDGEGLVWGAIRTALSSVSELTVLQMQDLLGLGAESRMNQPSTVGKNWRWRAKSSDFSPEIAKKLYNYCRIYSRLPAKPETEEDDTDEITAEVAAEQSPAKE